MKITWFGGTTFRIYVGGEIIVTDSDSAPTDMKSHEITSAADHQIGMASSNKDLPFLDVENWRRRKPVRLIDAREDQACELYALRKDGVMIDAPEEGVVIIVPATNTTWGRFADEAVVIMYGAPEALLEGLLSLANAALPKLILIATSSLPDLQLSALSEQKIDCALQILEPGFAIEA